MLLNLNCKFKSPFFFWCGDGATLVFFFLCIFSLVAIIRNVYVSSWPAGNLQIKIHIPINTVFLYILHNISFKNILIKSFLTFDTELAYALNSIIHICKVILVLCSELCILYESGALKQEYGNIISLVQWLECLPCMKNVVKPNTWSNVVYIKHCTTCPTWNGQQSHSVNVVCSIFIIMPSHNE